jgi:hypothetical protein
MYCGTRKHYLVGEVQSAYESIPAQAGKNENEGEDVRRLQSTGHSSLA